MPIREYAPLCLARALAGGEPMRLGEDLSPEKMIAHQRGVVKFLLASRRTAMLGIPDGRKSQMFASFS